ncbi:hypothetical protein CIB84_017454, partial [Bambusicola thoracicus]
MSIRCIHSIAARAASLYPLHPCTHCIPLPTASLHPLP